MEYRICVCIFVSTITIKKKGIMKTITGETIEVKANQSKRTFTIRKTHTDGSKTKYRTIQMSKEEFESAEHWTANDWNQFLKTDEYYIV